jgi:hypothetical protein
MHIHDQSTIESNKIPTAVSDIALALHSSGDSARLASVIDALDTNFVNVSPTSLWTVGANIITFTSVGARNHCAAVASVNAIGRTKRENYAVTVFETAQRLSASDSGSDDSACARFIGLVSQSNNVFQMATALLGDKDADVFGILRVIELGLPFIATVSAQDFKTLNNFGRSSLFKAIQGYCVDNKSIANDLLAWLRTGINETSIDLYGAAMSAVVTDDSYPWIQTLREDADSAQNPYLSGAAVWMMGQIIGEGSLSSDAVEEFAQTIRSRAKSENPEVSLRALVGMERAVSSYAPLIHDLVSIGKTGNEHALHSLSNLLVREEKSIPPELIPDVLSALTSTPAKNDGTLSSIDHYLSRLLKAPSTENVAIDFLNCWTLIHIKSLTAAETLVNSFSFTASALVSNRPALSRVITQWLISEKAVIAAAAGEIIGYIWAHNNREPIFSQEIVDTLDKEYLVLLVRRMLGYAVHPEPLVSLTLSLLNTQDSKNRTYGLVFSLLTKEVGLNYLRYTHDQISKRIDSANPDEKELLLSVRTKLTSYTTALEALPTLKELAPPHRLRRATALQRAKGMREANEKAENQSTLSRLFTRVPIKAGTGTFSFRDGKLSDIRKLQSISTQANLPRRLILDPVGYERSLFLFRISQREEE